LILRIFGHSEADQRSIRWIDVPSNRDCTFVENAPGLDPINRVPARVRRLIGESSSSLKFESIETRPPASGRADDAQGLDPINRVQKLCNCCRRAAAD